LFAVRIAEKAKEFVAAESEIYQGNLPDGAKDQKTVESQTNRKTGSDKNSKFM
jgi:hypothetical protein